VTANKIFLLSKFLIESGVTIVGFSSNPEFISVAAKARKEYANGSSPLDTSE
jgi:hypothetical protein